MPERMTIQQFRRAIRTSRIVPGDCVLYSYAHQSLVQRFIAKVQYRALVDLIKPSPSIGDLYANAAQLDDGKYLTTRAASPLAASAIGNTPGDRGGDNVAAASGRSSQPRGFQGDTSPRPSETFPLAFFASFTHGGIVYGSGYTAEMTSPRARIIEWEKTIHPGDRIVVVRPVGADRADLLSAAGRMGKLETCPYPFWELALYWWSSWGKKLNGRGFEEVFRNSKYDVCTGSIWTAWQESGCITGPCSDTDAWPEAWYPARMAYDAAAKRQYLRLVAEIQIVEESQDESNQGRRPRTPAKGTRPLGTPTRRTDGGAHAPTAPQCRDERIAEMKMRDVGSWDQLAVFLLLLAIVIWTSGCQFMPRTTYALNYQEAKPNSTSPFVGSSSGTMVPMLFPGSQLPDLSTAGGEAVTLGDDGKERLMHASGMFVQNGTFSRTAESDVAASLQALKDLEGSAAGQQAPTVQRGGEVGDVQGASPAPRNSTTKSGSMPLAYKGAATSDITDPSSGDGVAPAPFRVNPSTAPSFETAQTVALQPDGTVIISTVEGHDYAGTIAANGTGDTPPWIIIINTADDRAIKILLTPDQVATLTNPGK